MFEPLFYDPVMMPANESASILRYTGRFSRKELRKHRYDCRRKSHSNKYRYHLKRDVDSVSDLVNAMKNNNEYRKGKMLERQCKLKEQLSELSTEIFRNQIIGPYFYIPPIQLADKIQYELNNNRSGGNKYE